MTNLTWNDNTDGVRVDSIDTSLTQEEYYAKLDAAMEAKLTCIDDADWIERDTDPMDSEEAEGEDKQDSPDGLDQLAQLEIEVRGPLTLTLEQRVRIAWILRLAELAIQDACIGLAYDFEGVDSEIKVIVDADDWHILDGPGMGNAIRCDLMVR